ncbi:hypothetical protein [Aestuariispira ectoiniformans]|uniref:hypothetical protein n=1 Tax=Aestuariispira ectoiniformans TaxID=2775080 RepID=UPI00223AFA8F|nr:hypothetical protein [Aestuariispira ectoiniformans]
MMTGTAVPPLATDTPAIATVVATVNPIAAGDIRLPRLSQELPDQPNLADRAGEEIDQGELLQLGQEQEMFQCLHASEGFQFRDPTNDQGKAS